MAPVREVAFELECFEWADERLEVAGRWKGLAGRRLSRPVLTVTMDGGRRKRLVALADGRPAAGAESWNAAFAWAGDPAEITGAALEVGGSLVVELPLPDRRRRRRRRPAAERGGDEASGRDKKADEALRAELEALRGQVERLRAELAGRERELIELRAEVEAEAEERVPAAAAADQMTVEIARLAGERDDARAQLGGEVERLRRERDEVEARVAEERARWQAELDALREAFSDAAAEAEAMQERHREALAAVQEELRAERAQVARLSAAAAARPGLPAPATESARRAAAGPRTETLEAAVDAPVEAPARPAPPEAEPEPEGRKGPAALHALRARVSGLVSANGQADPPQPPAPPMPRPRRTATAARARAGATVAARRSAVEVWGLRILAAVVVAVMLVTLVVFLATLA
jgi:hypothetical protein